MTHRTRITIIGLAALAWIFGLILLFYATHKPFSPEFAVRMGTVLYRTIVAGMILALSGGIGRRVTQAENFDPLTRLALQAALGLGIGGAVVLAIGITIGVSPLIFAMLSLILIILFRRHSLAWLKDWSGLNQAWRECGWMGKGAAIYLLFIFSMTFFLALAPPIKYDALVYHLALPQAYLNDGRVSYLAGNIMSGMPQTAEMLYTWAMSLGGASTAAILSWCFGLLAVVGVVGFTRQTVNTRAGWVAGALLVSGATLAASLSWSYVEWLVALWGLGFLGTISHWIRTRERQYLILSAVLCGMGIGTKYPAGLLALIGIIIVAWVSRKNVVSLIGLCFMFGLIVIGVASPWLIKNLITTTNPVYPLLFPSGAMTSIRLATFQKLEPWGNWLDLFFLPIRASYLGMEDGEGYSFTIGPLLFGFGMLAWLGRKYIRSERMTDFWTALTIVALGVGIWAIGNRFSGFLLQTRMYLSIFPALAFLAGVGFEGVSLVKLPGLRLGNLFLGLGVLVLAFNAIETGVRVIREDAFQYLVGLTDQTGYLQKNLGWYEPAMRAIKDLPEGSRTLLLVEPRSFYCAPECQPDETLDRWARDLSTYRTEEAIINSWKLAGYSHVLFFKTGEEFLKSTHALVYTTEDWNVLEHLLADLPKPVSFGDAYFLYQIP